MNESEHSTHSLAHTYPAEDESDAFQVLLDDWQLEVQLIIWSITSAGHLLMSHEVKPTCPSTNLVASSSHQSSIEPAATRTATKARQRAMEAKSDLASSSSCCRRSHRY